MPPSLSARFRAVRQHTMALAAPLSEADLTIQASSFASPGKWHLGHTTWFFEEFLLRPLPDYQPIDDRYRFLFNSYYESVGARQPQGRRGLLSRPSLDQVHAYREHVDAAMIRLCDGATPAQTELVTLGLHHEQQHQELFLMDILHTLSHNPLWPAYRESSDSDAHGGKPAAPPVGAEWQSFDGGLVAIGHDPASVGGFAFDNESPSHQVFLRPYSLATDLVTWRDWQAFVDDGGYRQPLLWLSDGWQQVQAEGWTGPAYRRDDDPSHVFTLYGDRPIDPDAPVTHVSFFEADAYARWRAARLPTEAEWERAARAQPIDGRFVESGVLCPRAPDAPAAGTGLRQLYGEVWQWTASPYVAYPGFQASAGAIGEYNGKFMNGQYVLRGGSIATPRDHLRVTYRNFFYPHQRWPFTGLRLAKDA